LRYDDPVYKDAYNFRPYIEEMLEPIIEEVVPQEINIPRPKLPTHIPLVNEEDLWERFNGNVMERYEAELSWKNLFSEQKPDLPYRRLDYVHYARVLHSKSKQRDRRSGITISRLLSEPKSYENPLYFKPQALNWGQNQRSDDGPSFSAGVAQRIRRMTYEENRIEYREQEAFGNHLWMKFKTFMQWTDPEKYDEMAYEDAFYRFQERRADRSGTLKQMSLNRADPDYVDFLTAKTQWKMKDKEFPVAKPLQPIFVRSDAYLFKFGPWGIYLLNKFLKAVPPNVYIHAGKTWAQMQDWFSKHFIDGQNFQMSDVKGLDGVVRGAALTFFAHFMRHFGVPDQIVEDYLEDKMDMKTATMHFGIMTFSGEVFTYLINTVFAIAVELAQLQIQIGDPYGGSGDDGIHNERPPDPEYEEWEHIIPIEHKRYVSDVGDFCTYLVKNGIIIKEPIVFYKRLMGQIERGKLKDSLLGYFQLFSQQYALGDLLYDILSDEQMDCVAQINTVFFNLKRYHYTKSLPWEKLRVIEEEYEWRDEQVAQTFWQDMGKFDLDVLPLTDTQVEEHYANDGLWAALME